MRRQGLRSTGAYHVSICFSHLCDKIPPSEVNVEFWDLLPTLWSLRRPRKRYSGTLTEREISKNGKWRVNGQRNNHCIDRYLTLVTCMNESIVRIAQEHGKTPQVHCPIQRIELLIGNILQKAVVKMENYHRLHATLSRLKIPVLDSIR